MTNNLRIFSGRHEISALRDFLRVKNGQNSPAIGVAATGIRTGMTGIRTVFRVFIAVSGSISKKESQ